MASPRGTYKLDYYDAKNICESKGARLASYEDVEIAFEQGQFFSLFAIKKYKIYVRLYISHRFNQL